MLSFLKILGKTMLVPDRHEISNIFLQTVILSTAGYFWAWFTAGSNSALSDPKVGVIMLWLRESLI